MIAAESPECGVELQAARNKLRALQREGYRRAHLMFRRGSSTVEAATDALAKWLEFEPTPDPEIVRRGVFRYRRAHELERVRRSEALIRRTESGPCEDPSYLALLAYQAASLEMSVPLFLGREDGGSFWKKYILGTLHESRVNAFAAVYPERGSTIVAIHSGLVDFVYQAARAVVTATRPVRSEDPRFAVRATHSLEEVEAGLDREPAPVHRLQRTLEAYYFEGLPRAFVNEALLPEHVPVLLPLVSLAERWVLAHEIGHGVAAARRFEGAANPAQAEERFADQDATFLTVLSTDLLDRLPPENSLSGGIFALACTEVLRRALNVLRTGNEGHDLGATSHPPYRERAGLVIKTFKRLFWVGYDDTAKTWELAPIFDEAGRRELDEVAKAHIGYSYDMANILFALWRRARPRFEAAHAAQRQLHPMWRVDGAPDARP